MVKIFEIFAEGGRDIKNFSKISDSVIVEMTPRCSSIKILCLLP